ncbi:kinetochore-associated Ndc80 complex subunit spc25 [Rhizina undulata]
MSHNSASTTPPPTTVQLNPATNSMAASLPTADLGFEALGEKMTMFTMRFEESMERKRRQILEEKHEFGKAMAEDKDSQRTLRKEIEHYKQREQDIVDMIKQEAAEVAEAESVIAQISRKKISREEHYKQLQAQIEELQETVKKKRELKAQERQTLASQASQNAPELAFWEEYLGMRIEGVGLADHLKIVFTHLVDSDWTKEFWFIDAVDPVVDRLNETRDFASFLKEIRELFKRIAE